MGTTYRALNFVGVPMGTPESGWGDFIEVRKIVMVVCAHAEADPPSVKFCPVCGVKRANRVDTTLREFPLPHVAHLDPFRDMDPEHGEEVGWMAEWYSDNRGGYAKIGELLIEDLNDPECRTPYRVIGLKPLKAGGYGDESQVSMDGAVFAGVISRVQDLVRELGIRDREVQVWCVLRGS